MKKNLIIFLLIVALFLPTIILAATDLNQTLLNIRKAVWDIFVVLVIICFIVAGIMFLMSQGDPEKMKTAKKALLAAVIGTAVGILAYSAMSIIKTIIGN
ncbi:hypothetical protein KKE19_00110 [Patescibacteria group bacterium]|nr:hypothetical protein [Patescibacteria group bacterium]MBU4274213.1 hypothetical protein [Patescibacteria group bacterium]MBU4367309.1 hypothetical protein [Patescibacteria group bacterium]MBU4461646.1 hypothetical protein [Patescibacteria group bacterium]MCG2699696.1 hypothetical protein [Candidatus Parcubacteria bacterium]